MAADTMPIRLHLRMIRVLAGWWTPSTNSWCASLPPARGRAVRTAGSAVGGCTTPAPGASATWRCRAGRSRCAGGGGASPARTATIATSRTTTSSRAPQPPAGPGRGGRRPGHVDPGRGPSPAPVVAGGDGPGGVVVGPRGRPPPLASMPRPPGRRDLHASPPPLRDRAAERRDGRGAGQDTQSRRSASRQARSSACGRRLPRLRGR